MELKGDRVEEGARGLEKGSVERGKEEKSRAFEFCQLKNSVVAVIKFVVHHQQG